MVSRVPKSGLPKSTNHFSISRAANPRLEQIVVDRSEKPYPGDDGRERIARARQAAEALFTPKRPVAGQPVLDGLPSTGQPARKPRVLASTPAAPAEGEAAEPQFSPQRRIMPQIPAAQFARIRSWVKYGMTAAQVARVYGVDVGEIERIVRNA
jgi:hypothetical protein